jgi:hypothetical protein
MGVELDPVALAEARTAYLVAVRRGDGPGAVVAAVARSYMAAAAPATGLAPLRRKGSISHVSASLAEMAVGDTLVFKHVDASNLTRYFQTARRAMNAPDAKWTASTQPDRSVRVRRNPDGFSGRDPARNALAVELAGMAVGASQLCSSRREMVQGGGGVWQNAKRQARRILDDPSANWSIRTTSKGPRITRTVDAALSTLSLTGILEAAAKRHGFTLSDLRSTKREPALSAARHDAMYEAHQTKRFSYPSIGKALRRDHTTVMYAVRRANGLTPAQARRALAEQGVA